MLMAKGLTRQEAEGMQSDPARAELHRMAFLALGDGIG